MIIICISNSERILIECFHWSCNVPFFTPPLEIVKISKQQQFLTTYILLFIVIKKTTGETWNVHLIFLLTFTRHDITFEIFFICCAINIYL